MTLVIEGIVLLSSAPSRHTENHICKTGGWHPSVPLLLKVGSWLTLPHIFTFNMQYSTLAVPAIQVLWPWTTCLIFRGLRFFSVRQELKMRWSLQIFKLCENKHPAIYNGDLKNPIDCICLPYENISCHTISFTWVQDREIGKKIFKEHRI